MASVRWVGYKDLMGSCLGIAVFFGYLNLVSVMLFLLYCGWGI